MNHFVPSFLVYLEQIATKNRLIGVQITISFLGKAISTNIVTFSTTTTSTNHEANWSAHSFAGRCVQNERKLAFKWLGLSQRLKRVVGLAWSFLPKIAPHFVTSFVVSCSSCLFLRWSPRLERHVTTPSKLQLSFSSTSNFAWTARA